MQIQPYLFLNGRCDEAIEFYQGALSAEVEMLVRFRDSPEPDQIPPGMEDKVMHATLRIGETTILASDGRGGNAPVFEGFSLSIPAADADEARQLFEALSVGGEIQMPLAEMFWTPAFGMLKDRFGISWMVNVVV